MTHTFKCYYSSFLFFFFKCLIVILQEAAQVPTEDWPESKTLRTVYVSAILLHNKNKPTAFSRKYVKIL